LRRLPAGDREHGDGPEGGEPQPVGHTGGREGQREAQVQQHPALGEEPCPASEDVRGEGLHDEKDILQSFLQRGQVPRVGARKALEMPPDGFVLVPQLPASALEAALEEPPVESVNEARPLPHQAEQAVQEGAEGIRGQRHDDHEEGGLADLTELLKLVLPQGRCDGQLEPKDTQEDGPRDDPRKQVVVEVGETRRRQIEGRTPFRSAAHAALARLTRLENGGSLDAAMGKAPPDSSPPEVLRLLRQGISTAAVCASGRAAVPAPLWRVNWPRRPFGVTLDLARLAVLADALEEAGADNEEVLAHCRQQEQVHVRGCFVLDLLLNKE
jgi:hypothetical protein